jgi:hypothetical protein
MTRRRLFTLPSTRLLKEESIAPNSPNQRQSRPSSVRTRLRMTLLSSPWSAPAAHGYRDNSDQDLDLRIMLQLRPATASSSYARRGAISGDGASDRRGRSFCNTRTSPNSFNRRIGLSSGVVFSFAERRRPLSLKTACSRMPGRRALQKRFG